MSFVYELAGYPTTKSQVFDIDGGGITDVAVQFPTEAYYLAAKGQIEQQIGALIGAPYTLRNVLVTTVGKSWASMYSTELPHGDPGVQVGISPAIQFPVSLGPVYFNEAVAPDPTLTSTSVDGGVLFGNLAAGRHTITASKAPFSYDALTFVVQDTIPALRRVAAARDAGDERLARGAAVDGAAVRSVCHTAVPRAGSRRRTCRAVG